MKQGLNRGIESSGVDEDLIEDGIEIISFIDLILLLVTVYKLVNFVDQYYFARNRLNYAHN